MLANEQICITYRGCAFIVMQAAIFSGAFSMAKKRKQALSVFCNLHQPELSRYANYTCTEHQTLTYLEDS